MHRRWRAVGACLWLLMGGFAAAAGAQSQERPHDPTAVAEIVPTGLGEAVDREVTRARAATVRFKAVAAALAAGYAATTVCVQDPPHAAMGLHYKNPALRDAILDPARPEILLYERMEDGTFRLNGVEYVVPIAFWTGTEPPRVLSQKLTRSESLGLWYLHAWI